MKPALLTLGCVAALTTGAFFWRNHTADKEGAALQSELATVRHSAEELMMRVTHQEQMALAQSNRVQEALAAAGKGSNQVAALRRDLAASLATTQALRDEITRRDALLREATGDRETLARALAAGTEAQQAKESHLAETREILQAAEEDRDLLFQLYRREAADRERLFWNWNDPDALAERWQTLDAQAREAKASPQKDATGGSFLERRVSHGAGLLLRLCAFPAGADNGVRLELQPDGSVRPVTPSAR